MQMRIVHMTSVHAWHDPRILHKECRTLARAGHDVHLVAPSRDGAAPAVDGITVHLVPLPPSRLRRAVATVASILRTAASLRADVYHFHDPEFLVWAPLLRLVTRRPVIYDAHEDLREAVKSKGWIPAAIRPWLGWFVGLVEEKLSHIVHVVTATPQIAARFPRHPSCTVVRNFPLLAEFPEHGAPRAPAASGHVVYVGGVSRPRGAVEMIAALEHAREEITLSLAGAWESGELRRECGRLSGWRCVRERGFLGRKEVAALLGDSQVGLVLLHPLPRYLESYPVKLFEYMAAGLPVLASDFPLWRSLIGGFDCARFVDPQDVRAIAAALDWFATHPREAAAMGERGRRAVVEHFTWENEGRRLVALYERMAARS
jgi:glycosyltransferase involved in cell wall biosynthesis